MKRKLVVTSILSVFIFAGSAFAEPEAAAIKPISAGDKFEAYTLEDAHGAKHSLRPDTKFVLISFEMELSKTIHNWLEAKSPDYLKQHKAEYVADITEMPGIITFLFARPKMKKYPFEILLADDENFAPLFPKQEGKIAVFELTPDRKVASIAFFQDMEAVDKAYFQKPAITVVNEQMPKAP